MTPGSYKREARRRTAQRVEEKTRALDPAAGLDAELGDRIERDDERTRLEEELRIAQFDAGVAVTERDMAVASAVQRYRALLFRAVPLVAHAVDVPRKELEAQNWLAEVEALKSDPRLVSPPVEGRSQDTTTPEEGASHGEA